MSSEARFRDASRMDVPGLWPLILATKPSVQTRRMDMRSARPTFECLGRLGKASPGDLEVDGEEWVTLLGQVEEHFRSNYEKFPDEFYFWGDFSGDRTLDLKIVKPTVLTARLLSDLQKYLQMNGQKMWRIRIPISSKPDNPHRVVVVYPHAIDIPPIYQLTSERRSWNMSRRRFEYARSTQSTSGQIR